MTPIQQLTYANLTTEQYIHFAGVLALTLDVHGVIDTELWSEALDRAGRFQLITEAGQ